MLKENSTILLTGGTSGIGNELFKQLYTLKHNMIVVARNESRLERLKADYPEATTYQVDLSSRMAVEKLCTDITCNHPDISILINNAGVQYTPTVLDDNFSFDSIEFETTVNFLSPVWLSTLLLPALLHNDCSASIVNISSGLALAPKANSAIYCANKAALHSYSQSLRYQLAETNVSVQEVILPLVNTPMTTGRGRHKLAPDFVAKQIIKGMAKGQDEIYIGIALILPLLMRISPWLVKNMLRRS